MTEVEERRKINAHGLWVAIDTFMADQQYSNDVELRWLATYAIDLKTMAYHVKTGNHETIRAQVEEFRLGEIRKKRADLAKQDAVLNQEALKLTVGKGD